MCWINSQNVRDLRTPVRRRQDRSGIGREGGDYAFEFYCDDRDRPRRARHPSHPAARPRRSDAGRRDRRRHHESASARRRARAPASTSCAPRYAELQVTDLAASEHFYCDLLGMIVSRARPTTRCTCAAGRSASTTRSCCAGRAAAAARLALRVRSAADLDPLASRSSSAAVERCGSTGRASREWVDALRVVGSVRLPARVLPRDDPVRDPASALRPPPGRADPAPGPHQPPLSRAWRRRSASGATLGFR